MPKSQPNWYAEKRRVSLCFSVKNMRLLFLFLPFCIGTLRPADVVGIDDRTLEQIEQAIEAAEKQTSGFEAQLPVLLAQAEEAQLVATNRLYAAEVDEQKSSFFSPYSWKITMPAIREKKNASRMQSPKKNPSQYKKKIYTPTIPAHRSSFILPARPEQAPDAKDGWYTFVPRNGNGVGNTQEEPFRKPQSRELELRQELYEALHDGRIFTHNSGGAPLQAATLGDHLESETLYIEANGARRPLTPLENHLAHRKWYRATTFPYGTRLLNGNDILLTPAPPLTGTHYCVVDAPIVVRHLQNGQFGEEHFFRSDGAIIPQNRLDFALGFYKGFSKQVLLLGAEIIATTLLFQRLKKAKIDFEVAVLMNYDCAALKKTDWQKNLASKLRFIPWNPFNSNIRHFVFLYAALEEAIYHASRHFAGPYVWDKIREKIASPFSLILESNVHKTSMEYATGIPVSAYSVAEFLTTGRLSGLESLSELFVGQPKVKTKSESFANVAVSHAFHFLRRFLIAFLTLRYVDGQVVKNIITAIQKDKSSFSALLKKKDEALIRAFVEKAQPQNYSLLSMGLKKIARTKKMAAYLEDAQVIYRQRLKAYWVVNSIFGAALIAKNVRGFFAPPSKINS